MLRDRWLSAAKMHPLLAGLHDRQAVHHDSDSSKQTASVIGPRRSVTTIYPS